MDRGWFETIQLLGLDVMGAVALAMLALDGIGNAIAHALRAIGRRSGLHRVRAPADIEAPATDAWPPKEWRPSH